MTTFTHSIIGTRTDGSAGTFVGALVKDADGFVLSAAGRSAYGQGTRKFDAGYRLFEAVQVEQGWTVEHVADNGSAYLDAMLSLIA